MSIKTVSWLMLAVMAVGGVLLLNYWASFQFLSTLVYAGVVTALLGLANLAFPFRFMGVRKRVVGAIVFVGGVGMAYAALSWPAPTIRVARPGSRLDEIMPEYHFSERHSVRIHAGREQVMQAVRQSTWSDLKSLSALMKIRGAAGAPSDGGDHFAADKRVLEGFLASGYVSGDGEHEILICGGANARAMQPLKPRTIQEFAEYREQGLVKMGIDFNVQDAGNGWSTLVAETRVSATDDATRRGMGRYWRLIVPGSGLLRREWLDGIKKRAERGS